LVDAGMDRGDVNSSLSIPSMPQSVHIAKAVGLEFELGAVAY